MRPSARSSRRRRVRIGTGAMASLYRQVYSNRMTAPANDAASPTARARRLVMAGERGEAERVVAELIARNFGLPVRACTINADWSSLNSLNGIVVTDDDRRFFFKFHQEEGEESTVEEYYRAELLQRAGLPVDVPMMVSRRPGHQVLLYAFRRDRQLAEHCLKMERSGDDDERVETFRLQADLDRLTGEVYLASLQASTAELSAAEPVHQLFHNRLLTPPDNERLAGRVQRFYDGQPFAVPGAEFGWDEFKRLHWRINGLDYAGSLDDLFRESLVRLDPRALGQAAPSPRTATPTTPMCGSRNGREQAAGALRSRFRRRARAGAPRRREGDLSQHLRSPLLALPSGGSGGALPRLGVGRAEAHRRRARLEPAAASPRVPRREDRARLAAASCSA